MAASGSRRYLGLYSAYEWRVATLLFLSYIAAYEAASYFIPPATGIYPAAAIGIVALFLGGLRLWPVAYLAGVVGALLVGAEPYVILIAPLGTLAQAVAGAYLLRESRVDPLFRRYHDTFYFMTTIAAIAFIAPSIAFVTDAIYALPHTAATWGHDYIASACTLLIITPFLLRWFAKPAFNRQPVEIVETAAVLAVLVAINFELFVEGMQTFIGIPLAYFLLVPLFWISLRLRPRFLTLALLVTAVFAIGSAILYAPHALLETQLLGTEMFLIALSLCFFIVVSLEEDRRVNTNLMQSQLLTLENAVERVRGESRAKNDFIAILAHELRNPLAPVLSGIDLLKLRSAREREDMEVLDMMGGQMATVRRLLDDLLDISRISEGKIALKRESVDLEATIRRAIISTNHHRHDLHQSLAVNFPKRTIRVAADPVRLEQIFSNLLTNASKYSNSGDTITLTVREETGAVAVEVLDEGVGLTRDAMETIFKPFSQIEQGERTSKGLGIGLALVQAFSEMHGGSVRVESEGPGHGSTFTVRLPIAAPEALETVRPTHGESVASKISPDGVLVLVVDDNDAAAGAIGRLLELQGYAVAYAYNGKQAYERAMALSPAAVLLDLGLPDEDGYTVAKRLREQAFEGALIALSGYSGQESRERAKGAGFTDYLVKPASLADLRRVLPNAR